MMRCNAASLMAGGGGVCLNFYPGLMPINTKSLYKRDEVQIHCSPYERWVGGKLCSGYMDRDPAAAVDLPQMGPDNFQQR